MIIVMKRTATRNDYEERVTHVVRRLLASLDEPLDLSEIAGWASASPFHFHRVFQGMVRESAATMIRRLRLERAAHQLLESGRPVGEIAMDAGYATHAAFVRAFQEAHGFTPSRYRSIRPHDPRLPCPNGVHFDDPEARHIRLHRGEQNMDIEIREIEGLRVLALPHTGPFHLIGEKFGALGAYRHLQRGPDIGLYYSDPAVTPPDQLRSYAGFVSDQSDPALEVIEIPAGRYAVGVHVGPYDGLGSAWDAFCAAASKLPGETLADGPGIEVYVDDCDVVEPAKVRTEMWLRLA